MKTTHRIAAPRLLTLCVLTLAAITASALAGCAAVRQPGPHPKPVILTASQVQALRAYGAGDTAFGLSALSAICGKDTGHNVVISPVSLATGLGMASLGARGATATAMARALHLPAQGASLAAGLRARAALLRSLDRPGVDFATSNRIWADPSLPTNHSFVTALKAGYQAGLTKLPLLHNPALATRRINRSIAASTHGHITSLLQPGSLGSAGWVLTDALYLNARWKAPFNHALTSPGSFSTGSGTVSAKYLGGLAFPVAKAAGWTAADLPYKGGRLSMLAVLPPASASSAGCQVPSPATVGKLVAGIKPRGPSMNITIPKVKLAGSESLRSVLSGLGMGIAFGPHADFSGLSPAACCLQFVQHAATLDMAEKGTVASAATAVGLAPTAARIMLSFDRPYLLVLRDSLTGEPLMMAWVANPAAS